jgi:hypothetical protein
MGLQKNANGSLDVYFALKAPAGKESNWVPTSADGQFEALFRFYGPTKPLFDKTWKLPDIEKIARMSPSHNLSTTRGFKRIGIQSHRRRHWSAPVNHVLQSMDHGAPKSLPITSDPQSLVTLFVEVTLGSYSKMQRLRATSSPKSARIC